MMNNNERDNDRKAYVAMLTFDPKTRDGVLIPIDPEISDRYRLHHARFTPFSRNWMVGIPGGCSLC